MNLVNYVVNLLNLLNTVNDSKQSEYIDTWRELYTENEETVQVEKSNKRQELYKLIKLSRIYCHVHFVHVAATHSA